MIYDKSKRTLTLEPKDCTTCQYGAGGPGEYTGQTVCHTCTGTGKGPRGGKGKCRPCFGRGTIPDFDNPIVCPTCGGNYEGFTVENFCDNAPLEAILDMPIRIVRMERGNTFNENYLGFGCLYSVTDYGKAAEMSDDDILSKVRESLSGDRTQATKIVHAYERGQEVANIHDTLVIVITRDGYNVRAMSGVEV